MRTWVTICSKVRPQGKNWLFRGFRIVIMTQVPLYILPHQLKHTLDRVFPLDSISHTQLLRNSRHHWHQNRSCSSVTAQNIGPLMGVISTPQKVSYLPQVPSTSLVPYCQMRQYSNFCQWAHGTCRSLLSVFGRSIYSAPTSNREVSWLHRTRWLSARGSSGKTLFINTKY